MVVFTALETVLISAVVALGVWGLSMLKDRNLPKRSEYDGLRKDVDLLHTHMEILSPFIDEAREQAQEYLRDKFGGNKK